MTRRHSPWSVSLLLSATLFVAVLGLTMPPAANAQSEDAPRTREAFEAAFTEAFGSGLVELTLPLFYWEGVDQRSRAVIVGLIQRDLARQLKSLTWLPAGKDVDRGPLEPNLPITARLLAEFVDNDGVQTLSMHEIGTRNGVYYIVLAKKRPQSV